MSSKAVNQKNQISKSKIWERKSGTKEINSIDKGKEQLKFGNWDVKKCFKGCEFKFLPIQLFCSTKNIEYHFERLIFWQLGLLQGWLNEKLDFFTSSCHIRLCDTGIRIQANALQNWKSFESAEQNETKNSWNIPKPKAKKKLVKFGPSKLPSCCQN